MRNTVGLDISAETFDAVALIDGQTAYKKFQNNQDGIESLKNWINGQSIEDGQNIYIIMEATGNYYEAVADNLADDYHVSVINPLKIKRYADYRFNRTKTDKQDAKLIAEFGQNALAKDLPKHKRPSENIQSLKRLLSLQNQLKEQLTAQKNRLKAAKDSFVQQIHQKQIDELNQHLQDVDGQIKQTAKADKAIQETAKRLQNHPISRPNNGYIPNRSSPYRTFQKRQPLYSIRWHEPATEKIRDKRQRQRKADKVWQQKTTRRPLHGRHGSHASKLLSRLHQKTAKSQKAQDGYYLRPDEKATRHCLSSAQKPNRLRSESVQTSVKSLNKNAKATRIIVKYSRGQLHSVKIAKLNKQEKQ